jgi:hypothetical protein
MAKTKKEKTARPSIPSKRANKYEEKLKINGTFEEAMKALVTPKLPLKKK